MAPDYDLITIIMAGNKREVYPFYILGILNDIAPRKRIGIIEGKQGRISALTKRGLLKRPSGLSTARLRFILVNLALIDAGKRNARGGFHPGYRASVLN